MKTIEISKITRFVGRRPVIQSGVELLVESIKKNNFLENSPVTVIKNKDDETYLLIDGRHRYEAAIKIGLEEIPAIIRTGLSKIDQFQLASQCNNAATGLTYTAFRKTQFRLCGSAGNLMLPCERTRLPAIPILYAG
jgi:hypothetical protein